MQKVSMDNLKDLVNLALELWPHHSAEELKTEFEETWAKDDAVFFLEYDGSLPVGFAQCQLRYDYVEGTDSSPVGYLEAIYVTEGARNRGLARELLRACEKWAKEKGLV